MPGREARKLGLVVLAVVLCAFSFLKFLDAAFAFTVWYGLPWMAEKLVDEQWHADLFFLVSAALTALAAVPIASVIHLNGITSDEFRVLARYLLAFTLTVLVTATLVWMLVTVGLAFCVIL